jgi:hypothetical protein
MSVLGRRAMNPSGLMKNASLHRGRRAAFSDIWTIKKVLTDGGKRIMALDVNASDLEKLRAKLRSNLKLAETSESTEEIE